MRDLIGDDCEIDGDTLKKHSIIHVDDVWDYCAGGKQRPSNVLVAVNMDYVDGKKVVKEGDELAVFPPVTGG